MALLVLPHRHGATWQNYIHAFEFVISYFQNTVCLFFLDTVSERDVAEPQAHAA